MKAFEIGLTEERQSGHSFVYTFISPMGFCIDEGIAEQILGNLDSDTITDSEWKKARDAICDWNTFFSFDAHEVRGIIEEALSNSKHQMNDKDEDDPETEVEENRPSRHDRFKQDPVEDAIADAEAFEKDINDAVEDAIVELAKDGNEAELHQYVHHETLKEAVKLIRFRVRKNATMGSHYALFSDVVCSRRLEKEEVKELKEELSGQFSDGWGEGVEQRSFGDRHGTGRGGPGLFYIKLWWSSHGEHERNLPKWSIQEI